MASALSRFLIVPEPDPLWALALFLFWYGLYAVIGFGGVFLFLRSLRLGDFRWFRLYLRSWLPTGDARTEAQRYADDRALHAYAPKLFSQPAKKGLTPETRRRHELEATLRIVHRGKAS